MFYRSRSRPSGPPLLLGITLLSLAAPVLAAAQPPAVKVSQAVQRETVDFADFAGRLEAAVTVELRPGQLRFWAHLRSAAPREYLVHEWDYGGYEREVDLPDGYGSGVEASLANGQIAIRVLRGDAVEPLSIHPTDR